MSKLYAYVMSSPISEIRAVGVWNVIVAWNRCVHIGRATESLAETAGGVLRHMEMQWKGCHPRNIRHLIWGAHLRMAGLRGVGGEEGLLATALNVHFKCRGPEHWHFRREHDGGCHDGGNVIARAVLHETVRRDAAPAWIENLWADLFRSRQIQAACNILTLPCLQTSVPWRVPASGGEGTSELKLSAARRTELAEEKNKYDVRVLPGEVWSKLALRSMLSDHLKPR